MKSAIERARNLAEKQVFAMGGSKYMSAPTYTNNFAMFGNGGDYLMASPIA